MKKLIVFSVLISIILALATCDNGSIAFVNDVKPIETAGREGSFVPIYVTADTLEKFEGEADPALTYTCSPNPLPEGVTITGQLVREAGETYGGSPYAITQGTLELAGPDASNHLLIFTGAKLFIYQKDAISIRTKDMSKFQNEDDPDWDDPENYIVAPSIAALKARGLDLDIHLSREPGETPGQYYDITLDYTLTGENAEKYIVSPDSGTVVAKFYIAKEKEIIVTAPTVEKTYKDPDPVFHVSTLPAIPDGLILIGSPEREEGEKVGSYIINKGSLQLSGTGAGDYELNFKPGLLIINKKPVAVTADSFVRLKGDAMPPEFTYRNNQGLPNEAFTGELKCVDEYGNEINNTNKVGEFSIIRRDSFNLSGNSDGIGPYNQNYEISFVSGTLNVTNNIPIEVYANAQTQVYGDNPKYLTYSYTPALPLGLSITGELSREPGNDVGNYAITQGSLQLSGKESNLYVLHFTGANYEITPKPIVIKSKDDLKKTYNKTPAPDPVLDFECFEPGENPGDLGPGIPALNNHINEAFEGSLKRVAGENAGDYQISNENLALKGSYKKNYEIADWNLGTFEVEKCTVNVYPNYLSKVVEDDDPPFTFRVEPEYLRDEDNVFTGTLGREPGEELEHSYLITAGTLELAGGYTANYKYDRDTNFMSGATLRISTPADINISDPGLYLKQIIRNLHNRNIAGVDWTNHPAPIAFVKSEHKPDTTKEIVNKTITFVGNLRFWYDDSYDLDKVLDLDEEYDADEDGDPVVYYFYAGIVNLYGDCSKLFAPDSENASATEGLYRFKYMDMSGFHTQYVTNMYRMFYNCRAVKMLDLSSWSFEKTESMANLFDRCESLRKINFKAGGVDLTTVKDVRWIFAHNFHMTRSDLQTIIGCWKVSNMQNKIFTSAYKYYDSDVATEGADGEGILYGANRIISNDMPNFAGDPLYFETADEPKVQLYLPGGDPQHHARDQRLKVVVP